MPAESLMEPPAVVDGRGSPGALLQVLDTCSIKEKKHMVMTFAEYVAMREGLWLNDKNAIAGVSKTPPKPARPTPTPKTKPPHVPKSEGSLDQLHRSVDALGELGIGLLPPKKEDLKRVVDKQKSQVVVSQDPAPETASARGPMRPVVRSATAGAT